MKSINQTFILINAILFTLLLILIAIIKIDISIPFVIFIYVLIISILIIYYNYIRKVTCSNCGISNRVCNQKKQIITCKNCKSKFKVEIVELENYS